MSNDSCDRARVPARDTGLPGSLSASPVAGSENYGSDVCGAAGGASPLADLQAEIDRIDGEIRVMTERRQIRERRRAGRLQFSPPSPDNLGRDVAGSKYPPPAPVFSPLGGEACGDAGRVVDLSLIHI